MSYSEELIRDATKAFVASEVVALPGKVSTSPIVVAVGTVASKALSSPLLRERLAKRSVHPGGFEVYGSVEDLAYGEWSLAIVLSPFKLRAREQCDEVSPSARRSGVVDTIVRDESGRRVGTNTNVYGASRALRQLLGGATPERCLIAGTGASTRSCAVALRDLFGDVGIGVVGRDPDRTMRLANEFSLEVIEDVLGYGPDLVINATTVGEKDDRAPSFPLKDALVPGVRYFDLNNRTSSLQTAALAQGCATSSGVLMQLTVNALRARLLSC